MTALYSSPSERLIARAAAPTPAIEVRGLSVRYDATPVFEDVSFSLPNGCLIGVIGPNGAGKTTLLKTILGLTPRIAGTVLVSGVQVSRRGGRVAYVPQRDAINWRFPATVLDVVLMGSYGRLGWLRRPGAAERDTALDCLEQVGMQEYRNRPITQLSGGQQQRVFLARALAQNPDLLLLDEPISGVDAPTQETILQIMADLARAGKTLMITTHDLRCNMDYFSGLLALNRKLVALGPVEQVLMPDVLAATYGTQLVLSDGTHVSLVER